jgi:putative PIN family toxin of toxin-antitoxin system
MRVVIDTNVVVSAALKGRKPETVILFVANHPEFEWVASPEILQEYVAVLRRDKFHLSPSIIQRWIAMFQRFITVIEVQEVIVFPRDQEDAKFLTCAMAAQAHYLVTGDRDFEEAYKIGITTVLSVSLFHQFICEKW